MSNIKNREQLLNEPSVFQQIQERAYFISESTGFAPGRDHENWLAAEQEVLTKLMPDGAVKGVAKKAKAPVLKAAPKVESPKVEAPKAAAQPKATPVKETTAKVTTAQTAPTKRASRKSA